MEGGHTSSAVCRVTKTEDDQHTVIAMKLDRLGKPYVKVWNADVETSARYRTFVEQEHSREAFAGDRLVGIPIAEVVAWNQTPWVWGFHIDPEHQGRGLGRLLMDRIAEVGRAANCRVMVCETLSTNVGGNSLLPKSQL